MSGLISRRLISISPMSDQCFDTAAAWLQKCLGSHSLCSHGQRSLKVLPTRVIDVGPSDGSKAPFLHISNKKVGEWIALSHCWGDSRPLATTTSTLKIRCDSLPLWDLPPLFRDAVIITRRLDYRYLWIDSLCILQDSASDWQTESENMGPIFKIATFTIAAEAATNSANSILSFARSVSYPIELPCCSKSRQLVGVMYTRLGYPLDQVERSELSRRAWTLQEDLLSPRVLKWRTKQLEWSCRTVECTEEDPDGDIFFHGNGSVSNLKYICLSPEKFKKKAEDLRLLDDYTWNCDPLDLWDEIITDFSDRRITFNVDRLPAISGIAKEVARHTGYDYKAGLWLQNIHQDLLWEVGHRGRHDKATKPAQYIAPSWSWASLKFSADGCYLGGLRSEFQENEVVNLATVLSIEVQSAGSDVFGRVNSGQIIIRSKCRKTDQGSQEDFVYLLDTGPDHSSSSTGQLGKAAVAHLHPEAIFVQILYFKRSSHGPWPTFNGWIHCLILEPAEGDTFRRIGVARFPKNMKGIGWRARKVTIV
jgi:hypothetical protein